MDLLATVRKEGSRGGRGDFKWSDVQSSSHRENYLGHSLMAPVGRWQKGRDLNWYAKTDDAGDEQAIEDRMAQERKEELRKVKEAEQDAMARALGLPVPDRSNANMQEVSNKRDFDKALKEAVEEETGEGESGRGIGFSGRNTQDQSSHVLGERLEGNAEVQDKEMQYALREYRRRHGDRDRRDRSRSRDREKRHHHKHEGGHDRRRDTTSRRERDDKRREKRPLRYRSRSRSRDREERRTRRERSRSPYRRDHDSNRHRRER